VVVGASVGGYFLLPPREKDPVSDTEFGIVQTLRGSAARFLRSMPPTARFVRVDARAGRRANARTLGKRHRRGEAAS